MSIKNILDAEKRRLELEVVYRSQIFTRAITENWRNVDKNVVRVCLLRAVTELDMMIETQRKYEHSI